VNPPSPSPLSPPVRHNAAASRFEVDVDGHLAVADYVVAGDQMIFTHTFVPPALRGRGIAEALVRPALEEARRTGRRVVPQCSYVARFIERHAEFRELVD
jgi:predicted GNAT family acetyltransferase